MCTISKWVKSYSLFLPRCEKQIVVLKDLKGPNCIAFADLIGSHDKKFLLSKTKTQTK